jgi:hypothetical protein
MSMVNANLKQLKLDSRQLRAWEIVSDDRDIRKISENEYEVKSQSGQKFYRVKYLYKDGWTCECPDYTNRKVPCKHIYAVELKIFRNRMRQ